MRNLSWKLLGLLAMLQLFSGQLFAAKGEVEMVIVADTRKFTGLEAWWGNVYNEGHVLFTVVTCIIVPLAGCLLGILADLGMAHLGIDLRKRTLAE